MARIISVHSFRGGTGKSNTTANIAAVLASNGLRVGVIDTDIQSPGIHILFGLSGHEINASLNNYLWHEYDIRSVALDVSGKLRGKLYLIPASIKPSEIARVLRDGYDAQKLTTGLRDLADELDLDVLLIDTHPGLNQETLLSLVISHVLLVVLRPDQQDYEGTGITIKVAQELGVPNLWLLVNKVPPSLDTSEVKAKIAQIYGCPVAAVIPHSDAMMDLASEGIFVLRFPNHPLTALYRQVAAELWG